ncbi:hypothetical protein [Xenorhabdus sp. KK7.4]|uniref:hypothetical protein n=1 Tax=Xenorhabdus sp. KK7.4 TaxID=1851572 RepID=UPI000C0512D3|nr:hypothetical protein [Xenorhabdus sp. KK7.4]PHM53891.1 hypothetical protein Xekk_02803 [Xenorhabdus sp. KK7.4]
MNGNFYLRLGDLSEELKVFHNKEYSSESDWYLENKAIKSKIVDLIIEAKECDESKLIDRALFLLFDNTGCQEDLEILNEIVSPLLDNGIITKELLEENIYENSPLSRWY